jgi:YwiC-like protein
MNVYGRIATTTAPGGKLLQFPKPAQPQSRLLIPREHGSWAIWALPLISGAAVGYGSARGATLAPVLWFSLATASAFLIYQPLEILLGLSLLRARTQREVQLAVGWIMALTAIAVSSVLELLRLHRALVLVLGLVALVCFGIRTLLGRSRKWRVPKQLIGAVGLTSTAAGAYYAITGRIDRVALLLWLASWCFAVGQIEYVQLRLRTAQLRSRREKARAGIRVSLFHWLIAGAAIAAWLAGAAPLLLVVAFIPALARLASWLFRPWRPLGVHILGFSELAQGVVFNVLLATAFLVRL